MELKNFCLARYGFEVLCRLLPFASVGFNGIIPAKAGSAGLSTPDGGSRAILGQPTIWMGVHLEIPGHGVTAKTMANGRPQKPYKLKVWPQHQWWTGTGEVKWKHRVCTWLQNRRMHANCWLYIWSPNTGNILNAEPPSCPSKRLPSPVGCGLVKTGLPTLCWTWPHAPGIPAIIYTRF